MNKEKRIIIIFALVFVLLLGAVAAAYFINQGDDKKPGDKSGEASDISQVQSQVTQDPSEQETESSDEAPVFSKTITVLVMVEGSETKSFTIGTDADYLIDALNEIELVEGEESVYGFYVTTVDGLAANSDNNEWWMLSKDGEMTFTGVSDTPIEDGDTFEFTLSTY